MADEYDENIAAQRWFKFSKLSDFQLDIVGFLAILGEGSIEANAQVSTLSKWIFAPRLLPAPQAMLRPSRPESLKSSTGWVTGISSGNHRSYIQHTASLVCDGEAMKPLQVRVIEIVRKNNNPVKAKTTAPLTAAAVLGCAFSVILFGVSLYQNDAFALMATVFLSFLSSLIGLSNKWSLSLTTRGHKKKNDEVPTGDVVVRYAKGCFLVVKCHEDVARELYFAPETINYLISEPYIYRLISLVGTLMLMLGVISLGNASTPLQIGFAGAYMLLNAVYWIIAALPPKLHWDTSCFEVISHKFYGSSDTKWHTFEGGSYTDALFAVISVTGKKDWALNAAGTVPSTSAWDQWLTDVVKISERTEFLKEDKEVMDPVTGEKRIKTIITHVLPDFNPSDHLKKLMNEYREREEKGKMEKTDNAPNVVNPEEV